MYPEPLAPTTNCPVELFQVKFASASKVFAVPEPVITLLSALLFIVVCVIPVKLAPDPTKLVAVITPAFPNYILLPTSI